MLNRGFAEDIETLMAGMPQVSFFFRFRCLYPSLIALLAPCILSSTTAVMNRR